MLLRRQEYAFLKALIRYLAAHSNVPIARTKLTARIKATVPAHSGIYPPIYRCNELIARMLRDGGKPFKSLPIIALETQALNGASMWHWRWAGPVIWPEREPEELKWYRETSGVDVIDAYEDRCAAEILVIQRALEQRRLREQGRPAEAQRLPRPPSQAELARQRRQERAAEKARRDRERAAERERRRIDGERRRWEANKLQRLQAQQMREQAARDAAPIIRQLEETRITKWRVMGMNPCSVFERVDRKLHHLWSGGQAITLRQAQAAGCTPAQIYWVVTRLLPDHVPRKAIKQHLRLTGAELR